MVSLSRLQQALTDGATEQALGELLKDDEFPHVHTDHSLSLALERMGTSQIEVLPVVNRANIHKLEGIVTLQDVLRLYGVGQREEMPAAVAESVAAATGVAVPVETGKAE